jgi:hypothetical protein
LGSGLGSYERYWTEYRPTDFKVRNVHNLYLETLAELGPVGLGLLVVALCAPLVAAFAARRRSLAAVAAGAYVAFLAHAAVDWDWQMPAVTLAALFCAASLLVAARADLSLALTQRPVWRIPAVALTVVLAAFAFVGLRGNQAIASSETAALKLNFAKSAAEARTAQRWAPWSSRPWQLQGEVQSQQHDAQAARRSLQKALAKDNANWTIWLDLSLVTQGKARRHALAEARRLNPLGPEVAAYRGLRR